MQKTATTPSKILDLTAAAFLLVAFLTGIAGALQTPTLSIFLADELKARPIMVGFFFTGSAIMGILVSQFLARHSDKQGDRKLLILLCCLFGVLACTLFAWNRNYFILLSTGVLLSSFASTANPQMFALAREHADRTGRETVMFSTFLRAQISLAWVIGPPLAYELAMGFSFHRCHRICCLRTDSLVVFAINTKKYSCRYPTRRNFTLHPQEAGYAATFCGLFNDVGGE